MPKRRQRKHDPDFKFRLVLESLRGEKTRAEIAREHDITKSLLYKWEQAFLQHGVSSPYTKARRKWNFPAQYQKEGSI